MISLYYLKDPTSNDFFIVKTKSTKSKMIYNKKNTKKDNVVKSLLISEKYILDFIKEYDINNQQINIDNEINFYREHYEDIIKKANQLKVIDNINEIHNKTKQISLAYGLLREEEVKIILEKVFDTTLNHSKNKFAFFDFYDLNFLIELKSYKYSFFKYPTTIIGTNKALSENSVFIFEFTEPQPLEKVEPNVGYTLQGVKQLYFIQYRDTLFKTFEMRYITTPNRFNSVLCYDIPSNLLTKIENNLTYSLIHTNTDYENKLYQDIIIRDKK